MGLLQFGVKNGTIVDGNDRLGVTLFAEFIMFSIGKIPRVTLDLICHDADNLEHF